MKLLLGIGGTESSVDALGRTIDRVAATGDDLTVAVYDDPEVDESIDSVETTVRDVLAEHAVDVDVRRLEGEAGARLVELAEREQFDRIVLGGGERSPMGKIRIGSVTEFVLLNASTTVSLVR